MATTEHPPITDTHVEQDAPGTGLAHVDTPVAAGTSPIRAGLAVRNLDDLAAMATAVARSNMFKDVDTPERAASKMLVAMSMGFDPMVGLTGIDIIDGNPTPNGHFWAAALETHPRYDYRVVESTHERCAIAFYRDGEFRGECVWTIEDAQRAGLTGKDNWKKYPRPMLYNRAITEGVRMYCPQLFAGIRAYDPEEMEEVSPVSTGAWGGTKLGESPAEVREIREYAGKDGSRGFAVKFENLSRETKRDVEQALRRHLRATFHAPKGVWLVAAGMAPTLVGPHPEGGETFAEAFRFDVELLAEVVDHDDVIEAPEPVEESTPAEEVSDAAATGKPGQGEEGAAPVVEPSPTPPPAVEPAPVVEPDEVIEPETNILGEPVATEEALAPAGIPADAPGGAGECDDATAAKRIEWLQAQVSDYARFEAILDGAGARVYSDLADAVRWRRVLAAMGYNAG